MALWPVIAAAMHMPMDVISSSPCTAMPPTLGSSRIMPVRMEVAGVMG